MKKLLISAVAVGSLFAQPTIEDLQKQLQALQAQIQELKKAQETQAKEVKEVKNTQQAQDERYMKKVAPMASNNHLFWNLDLRSTYDHVAQKVSAYQDTTGSHDSKTYHNNILTNRVILTGVAKPSDNLKATVRIEANNIYGMQSETQNSPYTNSSWVANETPDDTTVRVKEAFFNYHFGEDGEYMFSAGRRPATEGYPANLREGDSPSSPLAHLINMEFDGFSFEISNEALPDIFSDYGTWLKFCAGRGYSSSKGKWQSDGTSYSKDDKDNMDFAGFILVPYDNGQYSVWTETVWAWHVQGYQMDMATQKSTMKDFGDYFGENIMFRADGIGDGINDFLDDTKAFVSLAISKTSTNGEYAYTNTPGNIVAKSHTGHSIWIGADMPAGEDGRFGVSFVKGSKYWKNMTYGEDTLVGSMAAVRGKAYDVYYNKEIIPHLTAGLRYTYLDYEHPGSDGFFGMMMDSDTYTKYKMPYVESASDLRAYIRYQF